MIEPLKRFFNVQPAVISSDNPDVDGWATHTICVAGLAQVGKTSLLKAFVEYSDPVPVWHAPSGLPWIQKGNGYVILRLSDRLLQIVRNPGMITPTEQNEVLVKGRLQVSSSRKDCIKFQFVDIAGHEFTALSATDPLTKEGIDANGNPIIRTTPMGWLAKASSIILLISPDDMAGSRKASIIRSLNALVAARGQQDLRPPSIHVILAKADEYGWHWKGFTGSPPGKGEDTHPERRKLTADCDDIKNHCSAIAGKSPVQFYVCAPQAVDFSFGRNLDLPSLMSKKDDRYREGWSRRGVVQVFRDIFEFSFHNRGRAMGLTTRLAWVFAALLALGLLLDLIWVRNAYSRAWEGLNDDAALLVPETAPGRKRIVAALKNPGYAGSILKRSLESGSEPGWIIPHLFKTLSLSSLLRRDFAQIRKEAEMTEKDMPAWFDKAKAPES